MQLSNDLSAIRSETRDFLERTHGFVIGGELVSPGGREILSILDPSSAQAISQVPAAEKADIDAAVASSRSALEHSSWRDMKPHSRERLIHKLADLLERNAELIAELEALESGRRIGDVRVFDAEFPVHVLRYMAGWPTKISGETLPVSAPYMPAENHFICSTTREPLGVIAAITPWNVPLGIAAWKVAPAIAAGCAVVLKPAENTPLTALLLGELALRAGFPPGVINVVPGTGKVAGEYLVAHPGVDKVSFTGSTAIGKRIGEVAGARLKPVTLELGGKSPVVIMPDADLELAIPTAAMAIFANQGQNCCAGSRLYVHEAVYQQVVDGVVDIARRMKLGPSLAEGVDMCPLASSEQQSRVAAYVDDSVAEGAELLTGGKSPEHPGFYFEPTVLAGVNNGMKLVREEVFGPVLAVQSFGQLSEAIELANDSDFGLGASLFTEDINTAQTFCRFVQAGSVWVNVHNILDVGVPFGGFKQSGLGNDLGRDSVIAHTRLKANYLAVRDSHQ
ncbi:aldehyde dehydrogenase family protein [Kineobactrum salinum]|uniref:Aldehyde dehydrogenase family protein n=1 Tax=Kineobactrum salinum TaxID=2708301 RepID=A0A6C0TWI8_9GAMM|nr:aldehyde dehydrogenase family protein [Kineobactrum salinum]QIB64141.1 aldehyde dehydrogenase family protein [Kineobactrum salinum]